ncbi:RelA/SpoT domain-containing protein [Vibrio parahaemolyticus]|nr:RelA/SpoT domain-containing protein [Vibrio parahaemolyticus]
MNVTEFSNRWQSERPMYDAWGDFVVSTICKKIQSNGKQLETFLKQPAKHRVKDELSLIDKAFHRPDKGYKNPYEEIEDKVGCRFVVLLVDHIEFISDIIKNEQSWIATECRHFNNERNDAPLLFTYQSVHYVVRAKDDLEHTTVQIKKNTPCEIQIRSLLQHAYAELTHDAIYKSKTLVEPNVHRTVARSMALIETTDDIFSSVNKSLFCGVSEKYSIQENLDQLYFDLTKLKSIQAQKSSLVILDTYQEIIDDNLCAAISNFYNLSKYRYIPELIVTLRESNPLYTQSIVLLIIWMLIRKRRYLLNHWPLDKEIIVVIATDLGISLDQI